MQLVEFLAGHLVDHFYDPRFVMKIAPDINMLASKTDEKLVSSDFNHDPHSSSFIADQVLVSHGNMVRVMSWYDNE